jgi:hypothetical protein
VSHQRVLDGFQSHAGCGIKDFRQSYISFSAEDFSMSSYLAGLNFTLNALNVTLDTLY